jgi:hypothetical protein
MRKRAAETSKTKPCDLEYQTRDSDFEKALFSFMEDHPRTNPVSIFFVRNTTWPFRSQLVDGRFGDERRWLYRQSNVRRTSQWWQVFCHR